MIWLVSGIEMEVYVNVLLSLQYRLNLLCIVDCKDRYLVVYCKMYWTIIVKV